MPAMSTSPQPPRPAVAPQPPGKGGHYLAIALLLLALIVVLGVAGVLVGVRVLTHAVHVHVDEPQSGRKNVSIKTPLGSLEVDQKVNESKLGLPIYPGATAVKQDDTGTVNLDIANEARIRVWAAKYETADSLDKVIAFYRQQLGSDATRVKDKTDEGQTVFEIKHDKQTKEVALKRQGNMTVIELVHTSEGGPEAN
jgi:hypothetical protein